MLLVVDDDDAVCYVTARMLIRAGYWVLTAGSGEAALHIVKHMRSRPIELVITDVSMTDMNGPELAERLARHPSAPPVLFMSGATSPRSIDALPGPVLQKPFSESALLREVHRLVGEPVAW